MRLYLNDKEARLVRGVLATMHTAMTDEQKHLNNRILDRLEICFQLQSSENRSKREEKV